MKCFRGNNFTNKIKFDQIWFLLNWCSIGSYVLIVNNRCMIHVSALRERATLRFITVSQFIFILIFLCTQSYTEMNLFMLLVYLFRLLAYTLRVYCECRWIFDFNAQLICTRMLWLSGKFDIDWIACTLIYIGMHNYSRSYTIFVNLFCAITGNLWQYFTGVWADRNSVWRYYLIIMSPFEQIIKRHMRNL